MKWLEPWWSTDAMEEAFHDAFTSELAAELAADHPLHGLPVRLVARGPGDDALFELLDASGRYAVVNLTWAKHPEITPLPATEFYDSIDVFTTKRMVPDQWR
jgi:hypothetical protein